MHEKNAHRKSINELVRALDADLVRGLSSAVASDRLMKFGANELAERPQPGFLALLYDQFNNYLVIILLIAAAISLALGEYVDSAAIMTIVVLNAIVGVVQESKAEQALAALKALSSPSASVVRDGALQAIPARDLVVGDLVLLEAGNYVPADVRLIESINLKIDEASLTGESQTVEKNASLTLAEDVPLGDRRNVAFMGTLVTYGRGRAIVTATGMATEIGQIATLIQSFESEKTPLQNKLEHLGRVLGTTCLAVCGLVFLYGVLRDTHPATIVDAGLMAYLDAEKHDLINLFMTAVSLAIAAVPEGLPAIVTICLALGMQRMVRNHALIRKLPAVETLGCATVVCSDKTGTLTQNAMTVVSLWVDGREAQVRNDPASPMEAYFADDVAIDLQRDSTLACLLAGASLCSNARIEQAGAVARDLSGRRNLKVAGDPTEAALVVAAAKGGLVPEMLESVLPREQEFPFDSERKRMSTVHRLISDDSKRPPWLLPAMTATPWIAFVKGAPDLVVELCTHQLTGDGVVALPATARAAILAANQAFARRALRVLAVAYRPLAAAPIEPEAATIERDLVFVGLLGMIDPPRPEVSDALAEARTAGLRTVMITGDYKDTAEAIAAEIGLLTADGLVLSGAEIEAMDDRQLALASDRLQVCCRVSPAHKTRIVEALKARGHVVAMTGDGVNDAPALKRANIGIAMGIAGTDVAKETSDMVLADDNFASIVAAIGQGRVIYANIRKFVYYLLACNIGEILTIFGSMLLGLPIPMRPVQLLWLNLVTDGAPALALGLEKGDPDTMQRPPRSPTEAIIDRDMALGIVVVGLVDTLAVIGVFYLALLHYPQQLMAAQTIAFVTLCCSELLRAFVARSEHQSVFALGVFTNRAMVWAVGASLLLVLAAVYVPFLRPFFSTVPLGISDWLLMAPFILASPVTMEIVKVCLYWKRRVPAPRSAIV